MEIIKIDNKKDFLNFLKIKEIVTSNKYAKNFKIKFKGDFYTYLRGIYGVDMLYTYINSDNEHCIVFDTYNRDLEKIIQKIHRFFMSTTPMFIPNIQIANLIQDNPQLRLDYNPIVDKFRYNLHRDYVFMIKITRLYQDCPEELLNWINYKRKSRYSAFINKLFPNKLFLNKLCVYNEYYKILKHIFSDILTDKILLFIDEKNQPIYQNIIYNPDTVFNRILKIDHVYFYINKENKHCMLLDENSIYKQDRLSMFKCFLNKFEINYKIKHKNVQQNCEDPTFFPVHRQNTYIITILDKVKKV